MNHIEDSHQEALVGWSMVKKLPDLPHIEKGAVLHDYLYAVPNGKKLPGRSKAERERQGARLKRQGVKAGVSDLNLDLPMHGYHGMKIEMKKPIKKGESKPRLSPKQKEWHQRMTLAGYYSVTCYSWIEAKAQIEQYLQGDIQCTD